MYPAKDKMFLRCGLKLIALAVHSACEEIGRAWRVAETLKRKKEK